MTVQTTPLAVRLTDPYAFKVSTAGGTPVLEVDTLSLATKLHGRLLLNGIEIGDQLAFFNGSVIETIDLDVVSDGTTISLSLEQYGGGDLTLVLSTGMYAFDSTPAATIALTAGTDTVPRLNYIYITARTKVLASSTIGFPDEEHVAVATVIVQSAATVATDGSLKVHAWTDHAADLDRQGHLYDINSWIRAQHSTWLSGVVPTLTIAPGAPDNVNFATTAGIVAQLHDHALPVFDTAGSTVVYVVNDFTTKYLQVTDLNALLTDSANASMSGKYFNLVLWASVSEKSGDCKLFINLPSGSYNKQGDAENDVSGYTNFSIPVAYRGAAFLISRLTLRHQVAGGGTWTSILETDLRGQIPNVIAGGGAQAITTEFADSTFRLFDETDPTKLLAFELAGIAAGNTRTLTVPDASGTIALTSDLHAAVTLAADADVLLGLVGQQLQLNAQVANIVFAGPAAGGAVDPTFRALVDADIPGDVMRDAEHLASGAAAPHHARLHGAADHNVAVLMAGANENLGAYYLDIDDIAVPANPGASIRRLFVNTATGELSVRTSAGATVSLEAGGGGVAAHNLLDGVVHLDTVLQGCSRGSLIYGTSGLLWDELLVGLIGTFLRADGADVYYGAILDADIPAIHSGTAHHAVYTNAMAVAAVEAADPLNLTGVVALAKYLEFDEIAAPGAGAANKGRMYALDEDGQSMPYWVSEDGNAHGMAPKFRARAIRTAVQALGSGVFTKLQFDIEDYDPFGDYDHTVDYEYTVPVSGRYAIHATAHIVDVANAKLIILSIYVNGVEASRGQRFITHGNIDTNGLVVSDILDLTVGDDVDIRLYHNHGANRNLVAHATSNHFAIHAMSL